VNVEPATNVLAIHLKVNDVIAAVLRHNPTSASVNPLA
jgi:hypothetical protein